jgi:hypothetical protein
MPKRKSISAAEFVAKMEADPEYVAFLEATERQQRARQELFAADEAELVREIRGTGYDVDSVWDLANNSPNPILEKRFLGDYPGAYAILIRHLFIAHRKEIREGIIRALTVKDGGIEVENALLECFQSETDENLRWVLANALQTAMPYGRRKRFPEIKTVLNGK